MKKFAIFLSLVTAAVLVRLHVERYQERKKVRERLESL